MTFQQAVGWFKENKPWIEIAAASGGEERRGVAADAVEVLRMRKSWESKPSLPHEEISRFVFHIATLREWKGKLIAEGVYVERVG